MLKISLIFAFNKLWIIAVFYVHSSSIYLNYLNCVCANPTKDALVKTHTLF